MSTLRSIADGRVTTAPVEVVLVDDASRPACRLPDVQSIEGLTISLHRVPTRIGVPRARNLGVRLAAGDLLFMTDAHVRLCSGWDRQLVAGARENRVLAATIRDVDSSFRGYGCNLIVPFMGTHWRRGPGRRAEPVQIASSAGTVLPRDLFESLGGYDEGMVLYGAAEPEFSVRAWLAGFEVVQVPKLEILHRFKPKSARDTFIKAHRTYMVHNNIRFGLLYLSDAGSMQMIRHFSQAFPRHIRRALAMVARTDVWERKQSLGRQLPRDFDWFIERFELKNQVGLPIV